MEIWKTLHILSMFTAVTLLVGASVFAERVVYSRDVHAIRRIGTALRPLENVGIAMVIVGVVFGIITAVVGPFDLTQAWLVIAYVLVVALFVLGPIESAMLRRVFDAARTSPVDAPSTELEAAIANPRRTAITWVSILLYALIIVDMVTKPFL
jgi:hypothetical protein